MTALFENKKDNLNEELWTVQIIMFWMNKVYCMYMTKIK